MFEADTKEEAFLRKLVELMEIMISNSEKLLIEQKKAIKLLSKINIKEDSTIVVD